MLLCILEEDVGYRPSIKTRRPRPGSEPIDLEWKQSGNSCAYEVLWDRPARSSASGQARPGYAVTLCLFDMQKRMHWFFYWGIRNSDVMQGETPSKAELVFKGWEKGHWISNWEISCCVLIEWRLRGRDMIPGAKRRRGRMATIYFDKFIATVPFQVFAVLFSAWCHCLWVSGWQVNKIMIWKI